MSGAQNPVVRRAAQVVVAAVVTLAIVGLSRVPYAAVRSEDGELRLAWRFRSERVSACRKLSDAEQAALPAHMRRKEDCTRGLRPYRLTVQVGAPSAGVTGEAAAVALVDTVRARGAESDRPLFVFRRIPLAPGRYAVRVEFAAVGLGGPAPAGEAGQRSAGSAAAGNDSGAVLQLDATLTIGPRRVVLVTYDDDAKRLVVRTAVPVR